MIWFHVVLWAYSHLGSQISTDFKLHIHVVHRLWAFVKYSNITLLWQNDILQDYDQNNPIFCFSIKRNYITSPVLFTPTQGFSLVDGKIVLSKNEICRDHKTKHLQLSVVRVFPLNIGERYINIKINKHLVNLRHSREKSGE